MTYGAGKSRTDGLVMVLTFGTGIGSTLFFEGKLLPNSNWVACPNVHEGHHRRTLLFERIRKEEDLKWDEWAKRTNNYLQLLELLLSPTSSSSVAASAKGREVAAAAQGAGCCRAGAAAQRRNRRGDGCA